MAPFGDVWWPPWNVPAILIGTPCCGVRGCNDPPNRSHEGDFPTEACEQGTKPSRIVAQALQAVNSYSYWGAPEVVYVWTWCAYLKTRVFELVVHSATRKREITTNRVRWRMAAVTHRSLDNDRGRRSHTWMPACSSDCIVWGRGALGGELEEMAKQFVYSKRQRGVDT